MQCLLMISLLLSLPFAKFTEGDIWTWTFKSPPWHWWDMRCLFTNLLIFASILQDIAAKILSFSQQRPRAVCIMSGSGGVSAVTLRQPASSAGTVTFEVNTSMFVWDKWGHVYVLLSMSISVIFHERLPLPCDSGCTWNCRVLFLPRPVSMSKS